MKMRRNGTKRRTSRRKKRSERHCWKNAGQGSETLNLHSPPFFGTITIPPIDRMILGPHTNELT